MNRSKDSDKIFACERQSLIQTKHAYIVYDFMMKLYLSSQMCSDIPKIFDEGESNPLDIFTRPGSETM